LSESRGARPIVIFDSGLGGLTVVAEIHRRFPREELVFLADRARVPYASLSPALITRYAVECFDYLSRFDPKVFVIACNTVSAVCGEEIRARYSAPVLDVIAPTADAAAATTKSKRIGVIATTATVRRRAYDTALAERLGDVQVFSQGCPLFVPLVEEGWTEGEIPEKVVEHYLREMASSRIDTAVLGCTHYEYFRSHIQKYLGAGVTLINTPEVTAVRLGEMMERFGLSREDGRIGDVTIYSSDITEALYTVAGSLFEMNDSDHPVRVLPADTAAREVIV
jgi:glutamate racemase